MSFKTYSVGDFLFHALSFKGKETPAAPVATPTNHILVVDCSGSMSGDLPALRDQVKRKLPGLLNEGDTFTLIWFSGSGETGTIFLGERIQDLATLNKVASKIDQWLRPTGLTGFVDPLREVQKAVAFLSKQNPSPISVIFMSDGYDNCNRESSILGALTAISGVSAFSVVEYGYYANRALLSKMAETIGGKYLFAAGFDQYAPLTEGLIRQKVSSRPRVSVSLGGTNPFKGLVVGLDGDSVVAFPVSGDSVTVPEGVGSVFFLEEKDKIKGFVPLGKGIREGKDTVAETGAYALLSALSVRMLPDAVYGLLKELGDVALIEHFSKCFGKQQYSAFMEKASDAAVNPNFRCVLGYDPSKVPNPDAFTVIDLLELLAGDSASRLLLDHEDFHYNRISRGRINADDSLSQEDQDRIAELSAKMAATKDKGKVADYLKEISTITSKSGLKFQATPAPEGYSLENLVYNESKPNISILVKKIGTVDVSSRLPHNLLDKIPASFPTFVYRNYAIVKDGLVNVAKLPVRVSRAIMDQIVYLGGPDTLASTPEIESSGMFKVVLNLSSLPVINRSMVKSVKADKLFDLEYKLHVAQSRAKVFKGLLKEAGKETKESASFVDRYGVEGAAWLKEQGFTEYSGFSPKTVQAESTDFYVAKEVKVSFKGLSSLPSLNDIRTKMASKKVNAAGKVMAKAVEAYEAERASTSVVDPKVWLTSEVEKAVAESRRLMVELAKINFSIVVGQVWPFPTMEENTYLLTTEEGTLEGKIELREENVKILAVEMGGGSA